MGVRVVVAEDSMLLREGIRMVLERADGIDLVADAGDLPGLETAVAAHDPDVVLTDVRMPPTHTDEGIAFAVRLRTERPRVGVVVLSQYAEPAYATELFGGGSAGRAYLLKERISDPGQLAGAIQAVAAGGSVIDPEVVDLLVSSTRQRPASPLGALTDREVDVLDQIARGKSNAAAGVALGLSERAVEKHINALFAKLDLPPTPDVNRRVAAVLLFLADRDV